MSETNKRITIITTEDGSPSLFRSDLNETYHSRHGALRESLHVFIQHGLRTLAHLDEIHVLEVGFGTGLNAWLTLNELQGSQQRIHYTSLETFPLTEDIYQHISFGSENEENFIKLHKSSWEEPVSISPAFILHKKNVRIQDFQTTEKFDLIFYDAFGPPTQPEMWTPEIFRQISACMNEGAVFVTYCAKGQVRRDLAAAGLTVERLQGPPGKREMLRATKTITSL